MEPRKRPLESIENTVDVHDPHKHTKKDGLRFTLARIDEDEDISETNQQNRSSDYLHRNSNIPLPPTLQNVENGNQKGSGPGSAPNINLKHINNLIGMNQTFKNKSRFPASGGGDMSKIVKSHDEVLDREIDLMVQRNQTLSEELKQVTEKIDNIEIDINELKRSNKKYVARLQELKSNINSHKRKFEYLEDSIMKNVSNKEKLVNITLKEAANKLASEFEEFKFELNNQLSIAKNFKDEDIVKSIDELNAKKAELSKQLDKLIEIKAEKIKSETGVLEKQLAKFLEQKMEKSEDLSREYESKQKELNDLNKSLDDLQKSIKEIQQDNCCIQENINTLEASGNNFINVKNDMMNKIESVNHELTKLSEDDKDYSSKLSRTNEIYQDISEKVSKHTNTKLILENSIMNYSPYFCRIYINLPAGCNTTMDNSFKYHNHDFKFDKLLVNAGHQEILAQLKYFVSTNITSSNLSLILSGNDAQASDPNLFASMIFNSYRQLLSKSEDLILNCKAIEITNESTNDILDSSQRLSIESIKSPNDIASQIMLLDDPENFKFILRNTTAPSHTHDSGFSCKFYTININGKLNNRDVDSNLSFLNIADNPVPVQPELLDPISSPTLKSIMKYFQTSTKCFHLCQLPQTSDLNNASPLLQSLEKVYNN